MGDPAMLHRNAELMSNEAGQGIEGLGIADPNYLATVKANQAAHQDEANAAQYESDIKSGIGAATGVAENMSNLDEDTRKAILASQTGVYNTWQSRPQQPSWWRSLLSGASQVGAGLASNPAVIGAI